MTNFQQNPQWLAPNNFLAELNAAVRSAVSQHPELSDDDVQFKLDRNNYVYLTIGNETGIAFKFIPIDSHYTLWRASVVKNGNDRNDRVEHAGTKLVLDWVKRHIETYQSPDYQAQSYAKGLEPVRRTAADADALTDEQLESALDELLADIEQSERKSGYKKPVTDEMVDATVQDKNIIKGSFPKGEVKTESGKTPAKTNITQQDPSDGVVSWHGQTDLSAAESNEDFVNSLVEARRKLKEGRPTMDPNAIKNCMPSGMKLSHDKQDGIVIVEKKDKTVRPPSKPYHLINR